MDMNGRFDWGVEKSREVPSAWRASGFTDIGVQAYFIEGVSWKGKPTRYFAWVGLPEKTDGVPVPGMVLVHGGGGTAFADWVRLWSGRGYAAIAMDVCGGVPNWCANPYYRPEGWPRHDDSGPGGWGFDVPENPCDYWLYHAVHAVIRSHSFLASLPQVDAQRIGLTGVSWGGLTACLAAGLDDRFKIVMPVYGCGCLGSVPGGLGLSGFPERDAWIARWDPATTLVNARMPFLWVNGTNDFAFPLPAVYQSAEKVRGESRLAIRVNMPHGHGGPGEAPVELQIAADSVLLGKQGLPKILETWHDGKRAMARYESGVPISRAELNVTRADGYWSDRVWNILPAEVDHSTVSAEIPPDATAWYFNLIDTRNAICSSECSGR